ncbi:MAG: heme biosynthesis HemY N-terminal domain-containing protein [Gammaproteobacteria bacterium]
MKWWLKLALALVALAAVVGAAQLYFHHPVLVRYGEWQAQPPVSVVAAFALAFLAVLAVVVRFVVAVLFLPSRIAGWRRRKNEQRRVKNHLDAMRHLILGDKRAAQKKFARLADDHNESAAVYAAFAARLAENNAESKDVFLRRAAASPAEGEDAAVVLYAKAQLAYHQGQATEALALLAKDKNAPPEMLRLLYRIRMERKDDGGALGALYRLRDVAPAAELDGEVRDVIARHFAACADADAVNAFWDESLRDGERKNTELIALRVRALHRLGDVKTAMTILAKVVKQSGASAEVFYAAAAIGDSALCEAAFSIGESRIQAAEGKEAKGKMLPATAELAARLGYWGKARRYYQMANVAEPGKYAREIAKLPADSTSAAGDNAPVAGV